MKKAATVEEYIATFPEAVQTKLSEMRAAIRAAAPMAVETISYGLAAYKWKGMLVWFGAHKNHLGFYPRVSAITHFQQELLPYKSSKGTIQFPFDQPLPIALIKKIIRFRMAENKEKSELKKIS